MRPCRRWRCDAGRTPSNPSGQCNNSSPYQFRWGTVSNTESHIRTPLHVRVWRREEITSPMERAVLVGFVQGSRQPQLDESRKLGQDRGHVLKMSKEGKHKEQFNNVANLKGPTSKCRGMTHPPVEPPLVHRPQAHPSIGVIEGPRLKAQPLKVRAVRRHLV